MRAEAYAREGTLKVFLERPEGGEACDRFVQALGGRPRGKAFVPRYPPESERFGWGRYYPFGDQGRAAAAAELAQGAMQVESGSGRSDPSDWGIRPRGNVLELAPPAGTQGTAFRRAYERLRSALSCDPTGSPPLLPPMPAGAGRVAVRLGDPILAGWLANALASIAVEVARDDGVPTVAPVRPTSVAEPRGSAHVPRSPAPSREAWLRVLDEYCARHRPIEDSARLADLAAIEESLRREDWDAAAEHTYAVRRGLQRYDGMALSALELRIAAGREEWGRAAELLASEPPPPLDDPLALQAAVESHLAQGRPDAAQALLVGRVPDVPDTDAGTLASLLAARVERAEGRPARALERVLGLHFYTAELRRQRAALLRELAVDLTGEFALGESPGDVRAKDVRALVEGIADGDRQALAPLLAALPAAARDEPATASAEEAATPATVADPADRFLEVLRLAADAPAEARRQLTVLIEAYPVHAEVPRWSVKLGDLARQVGDERAAIEAYRQALQRGPEGAPGLDEAAIARALRLLLARAGAEMAQEERVVDAVHALAPHTSDPTLLLLFAESEARRGAVGTAASLAQRALPDVMAWHGPTAAETALASIALDEERRQALLGTLFERLADEPNPARQTVAELAAVSDPLDPKILGFLLDADLARDDLLTVAARLERIADALDELPAAENGPRSRADVLAALAPVLGPVAEWFLMAPSGGLSPDRQMDVLALCTRCNLAAADQSHAAELLSQAADVRQALGLRPDNLVELADLLYAYPDVLRQEAQAALLVAYRDAALALIERWPQGDPLLLDVVMRRLERLDSREGADVRALLESYREEAASAETKLAPPPEERPLDGLRIAIAGGDEPMRRRAVAELKNRGAAEVVEVPPAYERNLNEADVMHLLDGTDVVVEVWRKTKHSTSAAVSAALERLTPPPERTHAAGTGVSSILSAAIKGAQLRNAPAA